MKDDERKYGDDVPVMAGDVVRESGSFAPHWVVQQLHADGQHVTCGSDGLQAETFNVASLILVRRA